MTATDSARHEVTGEDKPRRYRFGYWAMQLEVLITVLGATGTLVIGLSAGGGPVNGGEAVSLRRCL